MTTKSTLSLFLLTLAAIYWLSERPTPRSVSASMIYVIDGDTIDVEGTRYRLTGIDTPETYRAECDSERARGDEATARLRELINQASDLSLFVEDGRDKYGRGLATLSVDGQDVGDQLVSEGLARRYYRGSREPWC